MVYTVNSKHIETKYYFYKSINIYYTIYLSTYRNLFTDQSINNSDIID